MVVSRYIQACLLLSISVNCSFVPELPRLVRALEQPVVAAAAPVHQGGGVTELHKFGDILVPQAKLELLRGKPASLYTQELAVLVFGKETLEDCCLTGSTSKRPLPTAAVNDIVVHVMGKFEGENVITVRSFLRRKCNNAALHKRRSPAE
ncbi:uncharacterized protein LOC120846158 [Ixodes scapularis]|uniref:uncharacterized protein LOC120846158 n=1 Tax=Ixodes scapularis TaxID=6945 RepID=UPI001C381BB1|nr:uncharacterized protein LOC120846158 [Ixodes scapularis]